MLACQRQKLPRKGAYKFLGEKEILDLGTTEGLRKYKVRTIEMSIRQDGLCAICGRFMVRPTFDHEGGRGAGKRDDRIEADGHWINAALHEICNGLKGSKRYKWVQGKYLPVVRVREVA